MEKIYKIANRSTTVRELVGSYKDHDSPLTRFMTFTEMCAQDYQTRITI